MPTLQELLALAQGENQRPGQGALLSMIAPAIAAQAGGGTLPTGGGLSPEIEAQIQQLSQPAPVAQEPVEPQSKVWQRVLAGLADAASTYAAGRGSGVAPTQATAGLRARDLASKMAEARNAQRGKSAEYEGKQRGAEARLRQLLSKQDTEAQEKARQQARDDRLAAEATRLAERKADIEGRAAEREDEQKFRLQMAEAGERHDRALAELRADIEKGSKNAAADKEALKEAMGGANQMAANMSKLLNGWEEISKDGKTKIPHPPMTPDQIRALYRRNVRQLGLDPGTSAYNAALAYWDLEAEPSIPFSLRRFGATEIPSGQFRPQAQKPAASSGLPAAGGIEGIDPEILRRIEELNDILPEGAKFELNMGTKRR